MNRFRRKGRPAPVVPSRSSVAASAAPAAPEVAPGERRARLMIAGEFSAGKTQLINGLVGRNVLPSNVTATALPPIWLVGTPIEALAQVDLDKQIQKIDSLTDASVDGTFFCLRGTDSPVLRRYDLIDTPGNSDPNIPSESWERMLPFADSVVWCTNATQAWRQSEKSVWDEMPAHLKGNATLLITHADRIIDPHSADRVLRRVKREASKYFSTFLMVSLIKQDDIDLIARHLDTVVTGLEKREGAPSVRANSFVRDPSLFALPLPALPSAPAESDLDSLDTMPAKVTPRRVTVDGPNAVLALAAPEEAPAPKFVPELYEAEAEARMTATTTSVRALMLDVSGGMEGADATGAEVIDLATVSGQSGLSGDLAESDAKGAMSPWPRAAAGQGRARALWAELIRDVDVEDPAVLFDCVERLLTAIDGPFGQEADPVHNPDDTEASAAGAFGAKRRTS